MRSKKNAWRYQKIEFSYGFAVLYLGERIALVATEDLADAVIAQHKRENRS